MRLLPPAVGAFLVFLAVALWGGTPAFALDGAGAPSHAAGIPNDTTLPATEAPAVEEPALTGGGAGTTPAAAPEQPARPAYLSEDQPFKLKDYEEPVPAVREPWWQSAIGMGFKMLVVLALAGGSMVAIKKFNGGKLPNLPLAGGRGRNLVVLETTHVSPGQAIHLVSIGGDKLLVVGSGPQGLRTLAEIDDPGQVQPLLAGNRTNNTSFNQAYDMETELQGDPAAIYERLGIQMPDARSGSRGWSR